MKKLLLLAAAIFTTSASIAQSTFFTKTCYRGAFAPAPAPMWTAGWTEWDPQNAVYPAPTLTINTNITASTTWSTGQTVLLQGPIYVKNGAVVTIQPGVKVLGDKLAAGSALIITKGCQLIANGTVNQPIVFTSNQAPGSRAIGDWGGVILLGQAATNFSAGVGYVEGLPVGPDSEYGSASPNNNDNSGSLKYVRIEFGGYVYNPNQEINGLTMGGVGKLTTLEHIQVSFTNDDAFEWFGGNVNAKWLVSYRNLDDDFDTDNGYSGNVQFGLVVRDPNLADNPTVSTSEGFESDNNAAGTASATPATSAIFSNITLIGPYRGATTNTVASGYRRGARLRRATQLKIYNSIFMDFQRGVHIDGSTMETYAGNGNIKFKNNIIAGGPQRAVEQNTTNTFAANAGTTTAAWFIANGNDSIHNSSPSYSTILTTPYNYTNPDYRPTANSIALSGVSFTDAVLSAATNSFTSTNLVAGIPSTLCVGNGSSLTPISFAATTTLSPNYCSLTWSVSAGVSISNSTAVNPSFTIATLGTFSVWAIVNDGNGTSNVLNTVVTSTCTNVSVKEINGMGGNIRLFPNPSSEITSIMINSANSATVDVNIFDITGKLVANPYTSYELANGSNNLTINTKELNNGIYFVTINTGLSKETVKLIVNH